MAKTKEPKKCLWGMKKAKNHHVIFRKSRSRETALPFSALGATELTWGVRWVVAGGTASFHSALSLLPRAPHVLPRSLP